MIFKQGRLSQRSPKPYMLTLQRLAYAFAESLSEAPARTKDVIATAQLIRRYRGESLIEDDYVTIV